MMYVYWDTFAQKLMQSLSGQFDSMGTSVGHVKILVESGDQYLVANLTGKGNTLTFRQSAGVSDKAILTINARVEMTRMLEQVVHQTLDELTGSTVDKKALTHCCLGPLRLKPTYRFTNVVRNREYVG